MLLSFALKSLTSHFLGMACTTFQARRLSVRYRDENGKPQTAATLNGTLATTRWLVAILEKKMGLQLTGHDIFVNVAGGVRLDEPAADLGAIAAVASSFLDRPIDPSTLVLGEVDVVTINDGEARELAGEPNLVRAARAIVAMGPKTVVVKRGEYGALLLDNDAFFVVPAYPLESVFDPTGAGDTFAGGLMGYLAFRDRTDAATMRRAMVYGSVMASFTVEDFSLNRLSRLDAREIDRRYAEFEDLIRLERA